MAPDMVTVTNNGDDVYNGYDHGIEPAGLGLPPSVTIEPGESAKVTVTKAEQLKSDHPDWFGDAPTRGRGRRRTKPADDGKPADDTDDSLDED